MPRLFLGHFGFGGYDTRIASGLGPEGKELQLEFLGISVVILKPLAFESELFPCSRGHVFHLISFLRSRRGGADGPVALELPSGISPPPRCGGQRLLPPGPGLRPGRKCFLCQLPLWFYSPGWSRARPGRNRSLRELPRWLNMGVRRRKGAGARASSASYASCRSGKKRAASAFPAKLAF